MKPVRRFAKFAWAVLGFNLLVILWGALVRASRSGEGCGDHWPLCNGTVVPHAAEIATIIEFTHRATTGFAFFSVVAMAVWAYRSFRPGPIWRAAAASLILIITEALLGAGLVLFRYTGADVSIGRAVYLSAHLINTLLMLAAMALTAWWGAGHPASRWQGENAKTLGRAIAAALIIGVSGAVAALSDTLFPQTSLSAGFAADFSSASPILVRLKIWHPIIAALATIYIAYVAIRTGRGSKLATAVLTLLGLQIAAGLVNLLLLAPVWMQLVHLLIGDLLWIALVLFCAVALTEEKDAPPLPLAAARSVR